MALVRSKRIFVYGLNTQRKAILEDLQKSGTVEVSDLGIEGGDLKTKETAQSISQFDGYMNQIQHSLAVLDKYAPEKTGLFSSRRALPIDKYSMRAAENNDALKSVMEINRLADKIHENAENARRIDSKQIALRPYLRLDVPMKTSETRNTYIKMGMLVGMWDAARLESARAKCGLDAYIDILSAEKEESYIWFEYLKQQQPQAIAFAQEIGLQEPSFSLSHHIPAKKVEVLEQAKADMAKNTEECEAKLAKLGSERRSIELLFDHLALRKDKYIALSKLGMTDATFVLQGYVLETHAEKLAKSLEEKFAAYVELETPENPADAPEAFVNNAFVSPVEGITETYSMPGATDIDPNPIMAIFYYVFFGMCFSDAGYGIMVMLACGILGFGKILEAHKRKMFQMFFFCGISTTFWGFMYGSFFGDALSAFSNGAIKLQPLWLDPISEPLNLLIFAVAVGLGTVIVGLIVKFYEDWRRGEKAAAAFDSGSWIIILSGIGVLAIGSVTGQPIVTNIGMWMMIGGAVLLVATHGRHNKNPIMKIFGGILGIYDITSYVGDILSYSRLMALGLTTGVIANVINLLGPVFGDLLFGAGNPLGIIIVVIVFIGGHLVNFALNMLGAYVHTNRLQYVEFFSKFYEGGGRKFVPLTMNTKYYTFSSEEKSTTQP